MSLAVAMGQQKNWAHKRKHGLSFEAAQSVLAVKMVDQSIKSWVAHLDHADTWHLRQKIFADLVFSRE